MKYIIIGGVAGGATAAARIRRIDEKSEIILIEKGKYISFANCGLPYYIGNTISNREDLFLQTPTSFGNRFNTDVRINQEVIDINPSIKEVTIRRSNGKIYNESYDKLLLSPGAYPFIPNIKGIDSGKVFTLRSINDTDNIKSYILSHDIQNAVIIGAGFIGMEMVENIHKLGIQVSVIEMANQVMPPLDFEIAAFIKKHIEEHNIQLHLSDTVISVEESEGGLKIQLQSGKTIDTDMVILSVGVRPNISLAQKCHLQIGKAGGIFVNEYLQTSNPDIYAIGDAIEFPHPITGQPWLNYLATPANRQGRLVADNMVLGNHYAYEGSIGTAIAKIFDYTIALTGLSEKKLEQLGIPYMVSTTHSASHAGYYPNAKQLTIKLTFSPDDGRIFGAQCVGVEGVDKRIDQIALIIKHKGTLLDLISIEHAYAPPYSSAKDPVAIAGYTGYNVYRKIMPIITWRDFAENRLPKDKFILDVRTSKEVQNGKIEHSVNIPIDELRERLDEIPTDLPIIIYCAIGLRGYLACNILLQNGFTQVWNFSGGYKTYKTVFDK